MSRTLEHITQKWFSTTDYSKLRGPFISFDQFKTDRILNNYLTQTMDNNVTRRLSFLFCLARLVSNRNAIHFIFPTVLRIEKTRVVYKILGERADYAETNRVKDLI